MECAVRDVSVHYVTHGEGRPVLVLHGAGVDHREAAACFEPGLGAQDGHRRIYPDLPGMGRTPAPASLRSANDVLDLLLGFADEVAGSDAILVVGHSAGAYYAPGNRSSTAGPGLWARARLSSGGRAPRRSGAPRGGHDEGSRQ